MNVSITNTIFLLNSISIVSSNKGGIIEYVGTLSNLVFSSNIISNNSVISSNVA